VCSEAFRRRSDRPKSSADAQGREFLLKLTDHPDETEFLLDSRHLVRAPSLGASPVCCGLAGLGPRRLTFPGKIVGAPHLDRVEKRQNKTFGLISRVRFATVAP